MEQARYPTPYPEINALLSSFGASVQELLGDYFVGFILHGSLASGEFVPQRSDIDFVVVTAAELPSEILESLVGMHAHIKASGIKWAAKLEGSYIPMDALRKYDPASTLYPALRVDGSFGIDRHGIDWVIQRHVIREQGIALEGPDPHTLISPVSTADLQHAARETLREWWLPQLVDHSRLRSREYQAYATLTMCRALYTLKFGSVVTKSRAAQWAQAALPQRYMALIKSALAWPEGGQDDRLGEILDFIRASLDSSSVCVL